MSPLFQFKFPGKSQNKYCYAFLQEECPIIMPYKVQEVLFSWGSALIKINFFQFSVIGALPEFPSNLLQDEIIKFPWQLNEKKLSVWIILYNSSKVQVKLSKEKKCRIQLKAVGSQNQGLFFCERVLLSHQMRFSGPVLSVAPIRQN